VIAEIYIFIEGRGEGVTCTDTAGEARGGLKIMFFESIWNLVKNEEKVMNFY